MKLISWILPLIFMLTGSWIRPSGSVVPADSFCNGRNTAFKSEERLTYEVYYTVIGLYANAGQAVFTTRLTKINDKPVYHLVGTGTTHSSYDWIYRVRDRYESYIDTTTLQPLRFIRNVDEGGYKINQRYEFNKVANTVSTSKGEYKVPACVQDVLSAIFYARNIDFSKSKVDDKIPFSLFLDEEVNSMYIRYMGKEVIKTKYGTFRAIKFKPLLVKGTIFEGGEQMTVWVTDDQNRIPVRIESPIVVGKVKVDMMSYANIRYPLSSLISLR